MNIKKHLSFILLSFICISQTVAQCPMCKMAAESNLDHGGTAGLGLNMGILFMLAMPYIIVATLAFVWYKNRKGEGDMLLEEVNDILLSEGQK